MTYWLLWKHKTHLPWIPILKAAFTISDVGFIEERKKGDRRMAAERNIEIVEGGDGQRSDQLFKSVRLPVFIMYFFPWMKWPKGYKLIIESDGDFN